MAFFRKRLSSLTNRSSLPPSESPEFSENTPFAELRHRFLSGAINRDAFVACTRDKPVDHKFKIDREGRLEWTMVVHDLYPTRQGTLNLPSSTFSLSHVTAEDLKHEEALPPGPMNSLHVENYAIEGNVDKRLQLVFNVVAHLPLFPGSSVVLYRVGSTKYARKIATWVNFWLSEVPPRTWIHRSNQVTRVELKIPKIEELHALVEKFLRIELGDVLQTMNERIWKRRSDLKEQAKVAMMVKDAAWVSMFGYDWQLKDSRAAYGYGAGDADAEA
ncbi:hypothetical protein L596_011867 [Steinernema carpocapsae]|nr:hypothetical protein L596_011867 [Steinernema carpocapsae]